MDSQAWIAFAAAILLALITLFSSYNHVFIPGFATPFPLPQQAGIPCIFIALAAAACELKLASNSRYESAELRARAADQTAEERNRAAEERERAAFRARRQAQCNLVQLRHQLDPSERNARRIQDVISLLEEYGGFA